MFDLHRETIENAKTENLRITIEEDREVSQKTRKVTIDVTNRPIHPDTLLASDKQVQTRASVEDIPANHQENDHH